MATTAQRLAEYEDLYRQAQQYDPNKFQNEFERSYGEATNYNKDLIEQQASALGEVQAVAPTLREKYMNTLITDPTAQMRLIAQARQAPITSYGTAANLLNARGNRYQDILGKALGGYQTSAQQANTAAENAWRLYQDAVQQDQFNRSLRGSGGGGSSIADLLNQLYGNTGGGGDRQETKKVYEIPTSTREPNLTNIVQDRMAKGVLDYQNAPNLFQKYLQLQKGAIGSLAAMPLAGIAAPVAYATKMAPSVWSDIKGLFNRR